jgi:hypothetical protein
VNRIRIRQPEWRVLDKVSVYIAPIDKIRVTLLLLVLFFNLLLNLVSFDDSLGLLLLLLLLAMLFGSL